MNNTNSVAVSIFITKLLKNAVFQASDIILILEDIENLNLIIQQVTVVCGQLSVVRGLSHP